MNIEGVLACEYENIVDKFGTWSFCVPCLILDNCRFGFAQEVVV